MGNESEGEIIEQEVDVDEIIRRLKRINERLNQLNERLSGI